MTVKAFSPFLRPDSHSSSVAEAVQAWVVGLAVESAAGVAAAVEVVVLAQEASPGLQAQVRARFRAVADLKGELVPVQTARPPQRIHAPPHLLVLHISV